MTFHVCDDCRIALEAYEDEDTNGCIRCGREMREATTDEADALTGEQTLPLGRERAS